MRLLGLHLLYKPIPILNLLTYIYTYPIGSVPLGTRTYQVTKGSTSELLCGNGTVLHLSPHGVMILYVGSHCVESHTHTHTNVYVKTSGN